MSGYPRYEVLSYDHPAERERWRELYHRFPPGAIDVFYLPEYAYLFELHGDGRACCFVYWESPDRFVIYPFHLRFIRDIPEFRHVDPEWTDIISPYGYGGYLASHRDIDWPRFFTVFRDWCKERQVVSELTRFHPLLGNFDPCRPFIPTFRQSPVVVLDLNQDPEDLLKGFSSACRRGIRKAQKLGVTIDVDAGLKHLDTFHSLYIETMDRREARDYYYFSRTWYDQLGKLLGGRVLLFHARLNSRIIASILNLYGSNIMHYFLGGSTSEGYETRANNLLHQESALWAKEKGIKYYNLGGGKEPFDSLFKFKASFSSFFPSFYLGQVIIDQKIYQFLSEKRMIGGTVESELAAVRDWFPSYRAKRNMEL